jgi:hypothetical protein
VERGGSGLLARVRQALGADRFDEVFAAGARLSQREAVAALRNQRSGTGVLSRSRPKVARLAVESAGAARDSTELSAAERASALACSPWIAGGLGDGKLAVDRSTVSDRLNAYGLPRPWHTAR